LVRSLIRQGSRCLAVCGLGHAMDIEARDFDPNVTRDGQPVRVQDPLQTSRRGASSCRSHFGRRNRAYVKVATECALSRETELDRHWRGPFSGKTVTEISMAPFSENLA